MKADIFFFISSVSTIIFTLLVAVLLFYLIKAARNLAMLSDKLKESVKESEEFVADLRDRLEQNMFFRLFFPPARKKRRSTAKEAKGDSISKDTDENI